MVMWIMSDRAIPRSFRFMEGFGVHTFRLVNAEGKSTFVKFHWKPKLGLQSVVWNEAVKINGADPDFHRRDLWDAIQRGDFPEWELGPAALRRGLRREVRVRRPRRDQDHPRGRGAGAARRAARARPRASTISSPRPSRSRSARRTSCPGSTSATTRCSRGATSRTSTRSSSGSAARTSRTSRSTRRSARSRTSSRTATWRCATRRAGPTTSRTPGAADGGPRESPETGFQTFPRRRSGAKQPRPARRRSPTTTARPGSSTSARPQIEQKHIANALDFELSKVETPAIRRGWCRICSTSTRRWPSRWPRACG